MNIIKYVLLMMFFAVSLYSQTLITEFESDTIAPSPPKQLQASIEGSGLCRLTWLANSEKDLKGYKVYYSYNPEGMFHQITNFAIENNVFIDYINLQFLNNKMYYCVVAVDSAGNHSKFSEVCEAHIPDIHPPITPIVKSFSIRDNIINIEFILGADLDAKCYHIMRKTDSTEFKVHMTISRSQIIGNSFAYRDTIAEKGYYEYAMQTEDESGIKSEISQFVPVRIKSINSSDLLINIEANYLFKDRTVVLKWKRPANITSELYHYVIFKREGSKAWRMYDSIDKDTLEYKDKSVEMGKIYAYKVVPYAYGIPIGKGKPDEISTDNPKNSE